LTPLGGLHAGPLVDGAQRRGGHLVHPRGGHEGATVAVLHQVHAGLGEALNEVAGLERLAPEGLPLADDDGVELPEARQQRL
jgi:hypothetical protein